jgi:hypothetical protein
MQDQRKEVRMSTVVLGDGKRLFEDGEDGRALEPVDSKTFGAGVVCLTYRPERS